MGYQEFFNPTREPPPPPLDFTCLKKFSNIKFTMLNGNE